MAATSFTPISLYYSSTPGNTPTAGNLVAGELAINTADGRLFYKDSAGVVQVIAGKGGAGVAGGSNTQVQYNSSGSLAGSANFTFNGTTVTIANDASISGLTVGKGGGNVSSNTTFGVAAMQTAASGGTNAAFGYVTLASNTSGYGNSAFGAQSLYVNTTGVNNSSFGTYSLISNTTGGNNVALGVQALQANTTAFNNTAVGYQAGYSTTTGTPNVFIGQGAGYGNTTGNQNVAVGANCFTNNQTGIRNIAIGEQAMVNSTNSYNTGVGWACFNGLTSGTYNTAIGYYIAPSLTTGSYNTYIGPIATASSASVSGEMVIAAAASVTGKGANTGFLYAGNGGGGMYQGNNSTLWSITSDQRLKKNIVDNNVGLEKITQIKVRNFEYRLPEEVTELDQSSAINIKGVQLGPIAQELKEVLPDCVKTESTGVMSVDASNLTWYLVNAIKELKAEIDQLKGVK